VSKEEGWLYKTNCSFIFYCWLNAEQNDIVEYCMFPIEPLKNESMKSFISKLKFKSSSTPKRHINDMFQITWNAIAPFSFFKEHNVELLHWNIKEESEKNEDEHKGTESAPVQQTLSEFG
jgi:hypothetical protein